MYSGEGENSENIHVELNEQNTSTPAIITLNGNDDNQILTRVVVNRVTQMIHKVVLVLAVPHINMILTIEKRLYVIENFLMKLFKNALVVHMI